MSSLFVFKSSELIESAIILRCDNDWSQEDFLLLKNGFLAQYSFFTMIDEQYGADRFSLNLVYESHRFTLNVEFYSESIWVEAADQIAQKFLNEIFLLIRDKDEIIN